MATQQRRIPASTNKTPASAMLAGVSILSLPFPPEANFLCAFDPFYRHIHATSGNPAVATKFCKGFLGICAAILAYRKVMSVIRARLFEPVQPINAVTRLNHDGTCHRFNGIDTINKRLSHRERHGWYIECT